MSEKELLEQFCKFISFDGELDWVTKTVLADVSLEESWDGVEESVEVGAYPPSQSGINELISDFLASRG